MRKLVYRAVDFAALLAPRDGRYPQGRSSREPSLGRGDACFNTVEGYHYTVLVRQSCGLSLLAAPYFL